MADKQATLGRRNVVARILADREDALVITGLGSSTWDVAAAGDSPLNFYLWGGMGGAAVMGLGLALAQPDRRVLVITGDGEFLLGLGALATIAVAAPVWPSCMPVSP
jgi:thiamine pyrophosphate-dependent acetolactate synthase large subunit-like protein